MYTILRGGLRISNPRRLKYLQLDFLNCGWVICSRKKIWETGHEESSVQEVYGVDNSVLTQKSIVKESTTVLICVNE